MVTNANTVSGQMGVRFSPEDRKILVALRKKLGVQSVSEILRMALRALATKEGVTL
jgi:hypothetical protein